MNGIIKGIVVGLAVLVAAKSGNSSYISTEQQAYCYIYGSEYDICPELLMAVIEAESSGRADAQNGDCKGLMQINEPYHVDRMEKLGITDIWDVESNIRLGADYLAELFGKYEDVSVVLTAYNCGEYSQLVKKAKDGLIPAYADKIMTRAEELERAHNK